MCRLSIQVTASLPAAKAMAGWIWWPRPGLAGLAGSTDQSSTYARDGKVAPPSEEVAMTTRASQLPSAAVQAAVTGSRGALRSAQATCTRLAPAGSTETASEAKAVLRKAVAVVPWSNGRMFATSVAFDHFLPPSVERLM